MNAIERKQKKLEKAKKRASIKLAKKEANRRRWRRRFGKIGSFFFIGLFSGVNTLVDKLGIRSKIQSSIIAQIMLNFIVALVVGIMVTIVSLNMSVEIRENVHTSYDRGYDEIFRRSENMFEDLAEAEDMEDFFEIIEESNFFSSFMSEPEIYVTDTIGNVLIKNENATADKLNILDVVEKAGEYGQFDDNDPSEVFRVFKIDNEEGPERLLIYISSPREDTFYTSEIVGNGGIFPYINGLVAFIFTFMLTSRKKTKKNGNGNFRCHVIYCRW